MIRIPPETPLYLRKVLEELNRKMEQIVGMNNSDFKGRRITNAGSAVDPNDYVTMLDVGKIVDAKLKIRDTADAARTAATRAATASGSGTGSTGGGGQPPLVDLYDGSSIVEAYAAANPTQLANSCQAEYGGSGNWDFMDGVVAALRAVDDRFGFNAKRGDVEDPSPDAVSYYHGEYSLMVFGSPNVYVIDIITQHCGDNPQPAWQNVTVPGTTTAGWMPTRS